MAGVVGSAVAGAAGPGGVGRDGLSAWQDDPAGSPPTPGVGDGGHWVFVVCWEGPGLSGAFILTGSGSSALLSGAIWSAEAQKWERSCQGHTVSM